MICISDLNHFFPKEFEFVIQIQKIKLEFDNKSFFLLSYTFSFFVGKKNQHSSILCSFWSACFKGASSSILYLRPVRIRLNRSKSVLKFRNNPHHWVDKKLEFCRIIPYQEWIGLEFFKIQKQWFWIHILCNSKHFFFQRIWICDLNPLTNPRSMPSFRLTNPESYFHSVSEFWHELVFFMHNVKG